MTAVMTAVKSEVAAADAALVARCVAARAVHDDRPTGGCRVTITNSTDTISVVTLKSASLRKPSIEASSGRSGMSPSVIAARHTL